MKKMNVSKVIYGKLKEEIIYGALRPGDRLLESEIAKRFNVSRTPIREVLLQLQSSRFVDHVSNKGATVTKLSPRNIEEIYDVRAILESHAVTLCSKNFKKRDLYNILQLHKKIERSVRKNDYKGYIENNSKFHLIFSKISKNEILYETIADLQSRFNAVQYYLTAIPGNFDLWFEGHKKVIDNLIDDDFEAAAKAIRRHVEDARRIAHEFFRKFPAP